MNLIKKKFSLFFIFIFLVQYFSFSQNKNEKSKQILTNQNDSFKIENYFNKNLLPEELEILKSGKILIRNTQKSKNMVINSDLSDFSNITQKVNNLKPIYLAEIIQIIPTEKNPELLNQLTQILIDIPSYKGIPYYSEHNKIWVDLYSKAKIANISKNDSNYKIEADFYMNPFGNFSSNILLSNSNNSLLYETSNSSNIKYNNITCIKQDKMQSFIYVTKIGNYWFLYGIGGVNAPKVPFLTERIELSFMNRIKTFCNYVFEKL